MNDVTPLSLKGHFLIAMPGLNDPNFSGTVVYICEHTQEGSLGIVINRIYPSVTVQDIFDELKISAAPGIGERPIFFGGPVNMNEVFILHSPPFEWDACIQITPTLGMSKSRDVLDAIAEGTGPEFYIIALGCSGWGANQMESEMKENVWLSGPASEDIIFEMDLEDRWTEALKKMGIEPALLTDTAGHA